MTTYGIRRVYHNTSSIKPHWIVYFRLWRGLHMPTGKKPLSGGKLLTDKGSLVRTESSLSKKRVTYTKRYSVKWVLWISSFLVMFCSVKGILLYKILYSTYSGLGFMDMIGFSFIRLKMMQMQLQCYLLPQTPKGKGNYC